MKVKLSIINPLQTTLLCSMIQDQNKPLSIRRMSVNTSESLIHWRVVGDNTDSFGTISLISGSISLVNRKVSSGAILLDMESTNVESCNSNYDCEDLEKHYKSEKMLNCNRFSNALFEFNNIEKIEDSLYDVRVTGTLTLMGRSMELCLRARSLNRIKPIYYVTETIRYHLCDGAVESATNDSVNERSYVELSATIRVM
ncbi:MAG: YceI family protein [Bacteroidales bacterium]